MDDFAVIMSDPTMMWDASDFQDYAEYEAASEYEEETDACF